MKLIRELDMSVRKLDPVQQALAEMGDTGSVDEFVSRFGTELRGLDREAAAEMIGQILEDDPAHQYGGASDNFIAAVLHQIGM